MKPIALALFFLAVQLPAQAGDPARASGLSQELERRADALVREEFNLTHGIGISSCEAEKPVRAVFLFPENEERAIAFWMETSGDEASARLVGPGSEVLLAWSGRSGETRFVRTLAAGKYTLEISCAKPLQGAALFAVKGSALSQCAIDPLRVQEIAASPASGFSWPYLLFTPAKVKTPHLLVLPNNTGFLTEEVEMLRASATCDLKRDSKLSTELGAPMLIPLFPRPASKGEEENLYLHALNRAALTTDTPAWKRVDLQLLEMIRDARARLRSRGIDASGKILLSGFSAAGSFANRFAMLHPEEVLAVAVGSPGGWPLAPVAALDADALNYPVGIADLAALTGRAPDPTALRGVRWFFFLGDKDENDAVVHRDSFSQADEDLIFRRFGNKPVARWKAAENLYTAEKLQARFALYPNIGHEITKEMGADIERFFENCIQQ